MNQRYFQWLAGDRRGEVVVLDSIIEEEGIQYITFKDDTRINSDFVAEINQREVTGKMMAEIENPKNTWGFKETIIGSEKPRVEQDWETQEKFEIPSADEIAHADLTGETGIVKPIPKKKKIELIPPRPTKNKFGKIATTDDLAGEYNDTITQQIKVEQTTPEKPAVNTSDPVYIMMEKAKKVDTEVDMTLTISLPSSHLFDVVRDSFDDGESKALEYIIENIDVSEIKEALKEGIKQMYGPNEDIEDNKLSKEDVVHYTGDKQFIDPTQAFEPEVVQEPVIRDIKDNNELDNLLKEKIEKINQENE